MLGRHRSPNKTPFKRRFAGRQMMARYWCYLDPLSLIKKKNAVRVEPPLAKLSGSAHGDSIKFICGSILTNKAILKKIIVHFRPLITFNSSYTKYKLNLVKPILISCINMSHFFMRCDRHE